MQAVRFLEVQKIFLCQSAGDPVCHAWQGLDALDVVRQWQYRPYLLNNEPVEVLTEIEVNFALQ